MKLKSCAILVFASLTQISCSSSQLGLKSQVRKTRVLQDTSVELTKRATVPMNRAGAQGAWQWRSTFALGAPMQSMVEPLSLGGGEWIVATLGGGISRWNFEKGFERWKLDIEPGVAAKPLILGNHVYVIGMDSVLRKVSVQNGASVWTKKLTAESYGGIAAASGVLYVNTADDTLWAVDEKTGNVLWTYKRPSTKANVYWSLRGQAVPVLTKDGKKLFLGFSDGTFVALEAVSGQTIWERKFDQILRVADVDMSALLNKDESRVFMVHADGALYSLSTADGSVAWTVSGVAASAPMLDSAGEFIYQGTRLGELKKINARTGSVIWTTAFSNPGHLSSVRGNGKRLLVVSGSHYGIYFLNTDGAILHKVDMGIGPIAPAALDGSKVYLISPRNHLLRFEYK